jgi:hypothetical protein
MPGRDPEAAARSAAVAAELDREMRNQGINGAELGRRLRAAGHDVPNAMWITRRTTGRVNLVEPEAVVYKATGDLEKICAVLKVDPRRFVNVVNPRPAGQPTGDQSTD